MRKVNVHAVAAETDPDDPHGDRNGRARLKPESGGADNLDYVDGEI